ncbi:hypothetical protein Agabi119p4_9446 [Agaricus bisporus var. burnettii]|uniref:Uncharacterized protein n=1 Tax=Agaricus bisporus var. burnettii TaxID=192524 RepID=A0A8H7EWT2_AGABI|nr:hypothetical protein Agabi119p4_9446 [Agaricus bisporus var. burnettii]
MADTFKPDTVHTINPSDPKHPFLFINNDEDATHIKSLTVHTEGTSSTLNPELIQFLNRLRCLERFVIHWKTLNWVMLEEQELGALVQLFSLPSLQRLEILASANFPLSLLRYFTGSKLCIAATTLATAVMPVFPTDTQARERGALIDLSLVGARNIREFRTYIEWQGERAFASLCFVKTLRCSVSWREQDEKPGEFNKDIGSLLQRIGHVSSGLEEFRILDWQNNSFDGYQFTQFDLASLTSLKRLHVQLGASPKADEKTMETMDYSLRRWLFPLLNNLPSPALLEHLHVMFSFVVPFPWPSDLHTWMRTFSIDLDEHLASTFPSLTIANMTFDLRGAHTKPFNWQNFNDSIRPERLQTRGVTSTFRAEVYRP